MTETLDTLRAAVKAGDIGAMAKLGKRLIAEPTSPQSGQEGQALLQQAMQAGNGEAAEFVAVMLASGMAGQQDWNTALDYLAHSASMGWEPALRQLELLAFPASSKQNEDADWRSCRKAIDIAGLLRVPEKQSLCESPRIRKVENFLEHRLCDWMIERARHRVTRAMIYDSTDMSGKESDSRTNSSTSFSLMDLDIVLLVVQARIAKLIGVPLFAMEKSMVLNYQVGQEFKPHHDYLDPRQPAQLADMSQFGQRLVTFLIYLNQDFDGAETDFPQINRKFRCDKGGALFFSNVDENGQPDPQTLHAGLPPTRGEKWLFSQWIRSGPIPA